MTEQVLDIIIGLGTVIGAAAAVTYWGGRISRSVEAIAEGISGLRGDISRHAERLDRHADRLDNHGQRISVVETRQGG